MSRFNIAPVNQTVTNQFALKWSAPESLRLFSYSKQSDIWSWGITVTELIKKGDPYPGIPDQDVAIGVIKGNLHPTLPTDCPVRLTAVLEECWNNDPSERPTFVKISKALDSIKL